MPSSHLMMPMVEIVPEERPLRLTSDLYTLTGTQLHAHSPKRRGINAELEPRARPGEMLVHLLVDREKG